MVNVVILSRGLTISYVAPPLTASCIMLMFCMIIHKPVLIGFSNIGLPHSGSPDLTGLPMSEVHLAIRSTVADQQKADAMHFMRYQTMLDNVLKTVDVPTFVFDHIRGGAVSSDIMSAIDGYYDSVISCVRNVSLNVLPIRRVSKLQDEYAIPGWNDFVDDRHKIAREAFLCWVTAGKPRYGNEFMLMKRTRARFKLALRYCQQHENMLLADACANSLADNDFRGFWKTAHNSNNAKATKFATSVGGCTGESNIAEM